MDDLIDVYNRFFDIDHQKDLHEKTVRVFEIFNQNRSSKLSFDGFLNAITMMNHDLPRNDRIDYLIR